MKDSPSPSVLLCVEDNGGSTSKNMSQTSNEWRLCNVTAQQLQQVNPSAQLATTDGYGVHEVRWFYPEAVPDANRPMVYNGRGMCTWWCWCRCRGTSWALKRLRSVMISGSTGEASTRLQVWLISRRQQKPNQGKSSFGTQIRYSQMR